MAINKKLIHFKTKAAFDKEVANNILDTSIVFIKDALLIYTHGLYYTCKDWANNINNLQELINTLVSGNASTAIESFNEIIAFLENIEDSESLDGIIAGIEQQIATKQDKITNNVTYSGTLTSEQVAVYDGTAGKIKSSGFTINKSVPADAKFTDTVYTLPVATSSALGGVKSGGDVTISSAGVITVKDDSHAHVISNVDGLQTALDAKQATISDLSTIRSGAAAGATAVQPDALATVATSGSYNDLTNKPTIPTVNNATLTIQKNEESVGTFTANANTNKTINITVPTKVSELANDSGYKTTDNNTTYTFAGGTNKFTVTPSGGTAQTVTVTPSIAVATSGNNGLMSSSDKSKLDDISTGAEANQNAFANVKVGDTTIAADAKQDTLTLVAGSNVTLTPDATNDKITITATDTTYSAATTSADGLMSSEDKTKLDGIAAGAQVNTVTGVKGNSESSYRTGNINITKSNIGLGNVDNTSDADKPVSDATQAALDAKLATLVSGTNIKTVNGTSLLGSGNVGVGVTSVTIKGTAPIAVSSSSAITSTGTRTISISEATQEAAGSMSAADKTKLDGIAEGANAYSLPNATSSVLGGVKVGSNITVSSGTISLTKSNVTSALGYTPPTANTNTTYTFTGGTNKFTVTPSGGSAQDVTVTPSISNNVTYSGTLTGGQVAAFDGTTGKIKASGYTIATSVPSGAVFTDTNTKVTSVGNHYTPTANSDKTLSADASSTTAATWGTTSLVTGVNLARDAAGHVTGLTVDSIRIPSNPNTDTTYSAITESELNTGTATTSRVVTAAVLSSWLNSKIAAADAMIYKGTVSSNSDLPSTTAKTGWTYKVATAGTYASVVCEVGDMIICLTDGSSSTAATWTVVQNNIDGAVTGPTSATNGNFALFNGTTGKIIKNSSYSPSSFAAASHSHSYTPAGTIANKTAGGTVSSSFTGTAHSHTFTGNAVDTEATENTTSVYSITGVGSVPTRESKTVPTSGHTHSYTPSGSVSSSFTGTAAEHSHTFTGTAATSGTPSGTTSVYSITGVGTLPSVTMPTVSTSYSAGTLTITHTAGSYTAGTLPTRSSVTLASSSHTHSVTAKGSISDTELTPAGSVSSTFTGTAGTASATASSNTMTIYSITGVGSVPTRSSVSVPTAAHTHEVTAEGSVSSTTAGGSVLSTFTGTAHNHTFTGTAGTAE